MSFFTSAHFVRPLAPPVITGVALASFVRQFEKLGVAAGQKQYTIKVKFGKAIDQDEKPTCFEQLTPDGLYIMIKDIDWDIDTRTKSLKELSQTIGRSRKHIYRAYVELGTAVPEIRASIQRVNSTENDRDLLLDSWSMLIGPIESYTLGSDQVVFIGWLSVAISGYGYLFPWKFPDLVSRLETTVGVRQVMELCRATWPVAPEMPTPEQIEMRRKLGELWPYSRVDLPWDWFWCIAES